MTRHAQSVIIDKIRTLGHPPVSEQVARPQNEIDPVLVLVPTSAASAEVLGLGKISHLCLKLLRDVLSCLDGTNASPEIDASSLVS